MFAHNKIANFLYVLPGGTISIENWVPSTMDPILSQYKCRKKPFVYRHEVELAKSLPNCLGLMGNADLQTHGTQCGADWASAMGDAT